MIPALAALRNQNEEMLVQAAEQAGRFAGQHAPSYSSTTSQKYQPPTTPPGYSQPNRY